MCNDFRKLKLLDVPTRFEYLSLSMMYSIYNNMAPSYLCSFSHSTRRSNMSYVIPHVKTQGSKSFMYNVAKLWNDLPVSIKSVDSKDLFKSKCKTFLFNKMTAKEDSDFVF